ncbi:hypothetical protein pdam_00007836 [Pocillopora damicornis]|uniref:Death domain-containing protein n=1 Tax=Pocillopora damicornis TaxID=46731 RepID=A0A3M6TXI4_POCDA|nr:hypothetical protein pdam_00007836 [Pocillopora damicornis]
MDGMAYTDTRDKEKKKEQWLLGVCRIIRKGTGRRPDATRGSGFLVKDLIIPDPVSNSNISYQYCLITTTQVINDAKHSLENCYLEFKKLNSEVKRVPLHKIANLQEALRTRNLVFIPIKPPSRSQEKESIFTYRPFKVTNVNRSASNDLLCVFVKDKDKSFDVIDLEIQRRIEQISHMINFQVIEDLGVKPLTTHSELTRIANYKPDGGVILERRENQDNKFIAVGCLDFADDESICPVFFPLSPTDTCQDGPQSTNATSSGEGVTTATTSTTTAITGGAGNAYENFYVSEKLVLPEYKDLYEKLVRALDYSANRCIANWEHLACTEEVKAPPLVRLKCKLSTNYSHTQMLLEVLAVRENEEVVTVTKLIAALRSIGRNDIVKMITDVHCEAESSPQMLKDFKDCDSNNDLLEQIITKLDDQTQWRVTKHWRNLGQELKVSKKKLDMIEFCAPFNPTKSLMEYLLAEQNVTVKNFKEKVQQRTGLLAAFKALEPFLNMGCNQDKLMKDVIDLDNEYMDAFYVRLNKIIPGVDNWRQLATAFGIPRDIYKDFDPKEPTSPTKQLFEWLFADRTELTLDQLCSALKCIKRNDLVGDVRKCFEQC